MLKVTVTNRENGKKQKYKFVQHAILLGRQQNCDIVLDSTKVSRRHAKITVNHDLIEIEDLGSGNGTVVNHRKISQHKKVPIKAGDHVRVEEFEIMTELEDSSNPLNRPVNPDSTDPDIIEIKMIKKVLGALDQDKLPCIVVVDEQFADKKAFFEEGMDEIVVGRDETAELSLDSNVISRVHAVVTIKWGQFVVIDKESKNGTFVNGRRIQEKSLKDGDEIVFGTIKTIFKNPKEFDISAISESIAKEKEAQKVKEQKPDHQENKKENEDGISSTAASSVAAAKEEKMKENEKTESPGEKKLSQSEKKPENINKSKKLEEKKKSSVGAKQNKIAGAGRKVTKKLSITEYLLFGFGALVILIVVLVMVLLFM